MNKNDLVCQKCNDRHSSDSKIWQCNCGGLLDLDFTPSFPLDKIKNRKPSMWRYREAIPIENEENIVSFGEGFTPLNVVKIGDRDVLIKQDQLFPTGSYKDRGASVLMSKVKELGIKTIVEDSSGNAGSAVAAYGAAVGINCKIYVPASNSASKLSQITAYGAELHKIKGAREDTARAVLEAAKSDYYASHVWNPYFFQGTKTFAFEMCEQLDWKAPDSIVLPAGNGTLLIGVYIGLQELFEAGVIKNMPKLIAVQAKNCNPLVRAFESELDNYEEVKPEDTYAEGIAIAAPVRGADMLRAVRATNGVFIDVSEAEIESELNFITGLGNFIEPTSAAVIAGVRKYIDQAPEDETIVSVFTGNGLKSADKVASIVSKSNKQHH